MHRGHRGRACRPWSRASRRRGDRHVRSRPGRRPSRNRRASLLRLRLHGSRTPPCLRYDAPRRSRDGRTRGDRPCPTRRRGSLRETPGRLLAQSLRVAGGPFRRHRRGSRGLRGRLARRAERCRRGSGGQCPRPDHRVRGSLPAGPGRVARLRRNRGGEHRWNGRRRSGDRSRGRLDLGNHRAEPRSAEHRNGARHPLVDRRNVRRHRHRAAHDGRHAVRGRPDGRSCRRLPVYRSRLLLGAGILPAYVRGPRRRIARDAEKTC